MALGRLRRLTMHLSLRGCGRSYLYHHSQAIPYLIDDELLVAEVQCVAPALELHFIKRRRRPRSPIVRDVDLSSVKVRADSLQSGGLPPTPGPIFPSWMVASDNIGNRVVSPHIRRKAAAPGHWYCWRTIAVIL